MRVRGVRSREFIEITMNVVCGTSIVEHIEKVNKVHPLIICQKDLPFVHAAIEHVICFVGFASQSVHGDQFFRIQASNAIESGYF